MYKLCILGLREMILAFECSESGIIKEHGKVQTREINYSTVKKCPSK